MNAPASGALHDAKLMDRIFGWPPVYWTARILLVIVMGGGAWILFVLFARFLRPKVVWALFKSDPPMLDEVGGEFAGAKATVKFSRHDEALKSLDARVVTLEENVGKLRLAVTTASAPGNAVDPPSDSKEGGNGRRTARPGTQAPG